jgi:hypothetical protein
MFDGMKPTRVLWVSPTGPAKGATGTATSPFPTIQAAVDHATPGTAIMVKAGTYNGTVLFKQENSGTATAPIWLISADGPQKAHIVAPTHGAAAIGGGGVSNIVVEGFWVTGGKNGIQFSQDGFTFTKMISNIVVAGNLIEGAQQDGIKANGGSNVYIHDNVIRNGEADQGIDFVAVNNSSITNNEIYGITGSTGIFAKGGSTNDLIANNYIHDIVNDGISMGNKMGDDPWMPGYTGYEAKNLTVTGNQVVNVGGRALIVDGAINSVVSGNYLATNGKYFTIDVKADVSPINGVMTTMLSKNVNITGNTLGPTTKAVNFNPGYGSSVTTTSNITSTHWTGSAGAHAVIMPNIVGVPTGFVAGGSHTSSTSVSSASVGSTPVASTAPLIGSQAWEAYLLSSASTASSSHTSSTAASPHISTYAPLAAEVHTAAPVTDYHPATTVHDSASVASMLDASHITAYAYGSTHFI